MTDMLSLKNIEDELTLTLCNKNKASEYCFGCGPAGDTTEVGQQYYLLAGTYFDQENRPDYEYVQFCAKHFAFLMNLGLTHLLRVEKGRAEGLLTLPILQNKGAA